jgi:hypothetical protein
MIWITKIMNWTSFGLHQWHIMQIHSRYFCISSTFEMRTALCEIHLFSDKLVMHNRVFYIKTNYVGREQDSGEIERGRERERERECVRDSALLEMRVGVANTIDCHRKYLWQTWEINLRQSRWPLMTVFLWL